jgi:PAS domain S-box-containing protein
VKLTLSNSDNSGRVPDPLANRTSNLKVRNVAFFVGGALLYWVIATLIPYFHGTNMTRLSPFFVGAAGYFLGFRAGAVASLAALVVHTLVFNRHGIEGPFAILHVKPAAHIGIALVGPLTGRLRTITRHLQNEINRRRETEKDLLEVESRFTQIVDNIREAIWIGAADRSHMIYVSPAFEAIFGIPSNIIEKNPRAILDIVHPDDRPELEKTLNTLPQSDFQLKYRINRPDGAVRWIQTRAFVILGKDGKATRIAGISTDVTEQKESVLAHQASEEKYRDLVEKIPAIVYLSSLDLSVPILYVSPQIEFILGYPQRQWMTDPDMFNKLYHPDDAARVTRELKESIGERKRFVADYRMITKNGAVRWFHDEADFIGDEDGKPMFFQGVIHDITQRRYTDAMRLGRSRVLEKLAAGASITEVLTTLVEATEELVPETVCSISIRDRDSGRVHCGAFTSLPAGFIDKIESIDAGTESSCIGQAIDTGERVVIADFEKSELNRKFGELAKSIGMSACWCEPIHSSRGETLGALTVFLKKPAEPTEQDAELLKSAAELAGIAIEQRQTEAALKENEEQLSLFVQHSPVAVAMFDTEMRYLVASRQWTDVHGVGDRDIIGERHYDVFPDLPERWKQLHRRCLSGAIETSEADRVVRPDGTVDWIKWAIHPWRRNDGEIGGIIIFSEQVTEQKVAQDRLKRSEEQYRFLVEHMPDTITELDPDGNVLFANRVVSGGSIANVIGTDVTSRKNAEDALTLSENRYRKLFEDDLAGVFIATPGGHFITCNPAFVRMFGFESVDDALTFDASTLYPGKEVWDEFLKRIESEGRLVDYEEKLRNKDGKAVYVVANFVGGFDGTGNLTEIKGYLFDNTARKKLEEQLVQAHKMEAVGRLAGGIAHDFNNSLTSISGYNELLLNKLESHSPLHRYAQEVMKASDRAAGLTKRLLAFSRQQMIQPKVIDLNTVVHNMDKVMRRTIGEDIDLETKAGTEDCTLEVDPSLIETIILNLAINARDAMPEGGKLSIQTGKTTVDKVNQHRTPGIDLGRYVVLSVSDTGVGMDRETQARIFEPFFTTKEQGRGTGLGLSTVYGAVRQSGGHVRVSSQPHKGATFTLYFPSIEDRKPVSTRREMFLGPSQGTETVLVAEDEPTVRRLIKDVLENKGYRVLLADDGESALEVVDEKGGDFHLLIADVVMPRMNGRELAAQLRSRYPRLKVLYFSGYIGKASVKIAELGPGTSFLSKPFSSEALARKIRLLLDSPPPGRPASPEAQSSSHGL